MTLANGINIIWKLIMTTRVVETMTENTSGMAHAPHPLSVIETSNLQHIVEISFS